MVGGSPKAVSSIGVSGHTSVRHLRAVFFDLVSSSALDTIKLLASVPSEIRAGSSGLPAEALVNDVERRFLRIVNNLTLHADALKEPLLEFPRSIELVKNFKGWIESVATLTRNVERHLDDVFSNLQIQAQLTPPPANEVFALDGDRGGWEQSDVDGDKHEVDVGALALHFAQHREFTKLQIAQIDEALGFIGSSVDSYQERTTFDPSDIIATTASPIFYGYSSFAEPRYITTMSKEAVRDFLLVANSLLTQLAAKADNCQSQDTWRRLLSHASSSDRIEREFVRGPVCSSFLEVERGTITYSITSIPASIFNNKDFQSYIAQLYLLQVESRDLCGVYSELEVDPGKALVELKVILPRSGQATEVFSTTARRLLGLEPQLPSVPDNVTIPYGNPESPIYGSFPTEVLRSPPGREVVALGYELGMQVVKEMSLRLNEFRLLFNISDDLHTLEDRVRSGHVGFEYSFGNRGVSTVYATLQAGDRKLPVCLPQGASCLCLPYNALSHPELVPSLRSLISSVDCFQIKALTEERFVSPDDNKLDIFVWMLRGAVREVDKIKEMARKRYGDGDDAISVVVTPKPTEGYGLPLYYVQFFDRNGCELARYGGLDDNKNLVLLETVTAAYYQQFHVSFSVLSKIVKDYERNPEDMSIVRIYGRFTSAGILITEAFARALLSGLQSGAPYGVLVESFLDPLWQVSQMKRYTFGRRAHPMLYRMGYPGESVIATQILQS